MKMSVYDEEECFILFCFHSFDLLLNTDFFSCITAIIFMNTIKVRLYFAAVRNVLNCLIIEECFFVIPLKKKKLSFFLFFLSNVYIGFGGDMNSSSQPAGILNIPAIVNSGLLQVSVFILGNLFGVEFNPSVW